MTLYARIEDGYSRIYTLKSDNNIRVSYVGAPLTGYLPLHILNEKPACGDGEEIGYEMTDTGLEVTKRYFVHQAGTPLPPDVPAPRKWTRLTIKRALESAGLWETARGLMEAGGKLDDFYLCDYVKEGDEAFTAVYGPACEQLGKERVDAFIDGLDVSR